MTTEDIHEYLANPKKPNLWYFPFQVARETSDLAAILLYDLHHRISRQKKKNIKDGKQWTYDAMRVFEVTHLHSSEPGIRKAFLALKKNGFIDREETGKYNRKGYDGKFWYHVTAKGTAAARKRLMRYHPEVAVSLDIPKAVLLEHFRFKLHEEEGRENVTIIPKELGVPYHPKTIERHLEGLVELGILGRHPDNEGQYCLRNIEQPYDWKMDPAPITVLPLKLLPALQPGDVGLLVAPSGSGKTSMACFIAVQMALAGSRVLYVSMEEPIRDICFRMFAGMFGIQYSELHRGEDAAKARLKIALRSDSELLQTFSDNLKYMDLQGVQPQTHHVLDAIELQLKDGFAPHVVIIDQLEFITVEYEQSDSEDDEDAEFGKALLPALLIRECLGDGGFATWVIHQVMGECQRDFPVKQISGGEEVAKCFDCVVGIGRARKDSTELRMFSLKGAKGFEECLDADFPHMRFKPKE
jgi:hypothetical protein